jgi:BsuBI/PstI restriction endonuclease HTH domain
MPVDAIRQRLQSLFPPDLADRTTLVSEMSARAVFVFIYGGFIEGSTRFLRPSFVYFFTDEQAQRNDETQRKKWLASAGRPGFRPAGRRWYADTSRESIRDDLFRNRFLDLGVLGRREGVATTSSQPI